MRKIREAMGGIQFVFILTFLLILLYEYYKLKENGLLFLLLLYIILVIIYSVAKSEKIYKFISSVRLTTEETEKQLVVSGSLSSYQDSFEFHTKSSNLMERLDKSQAELKLKNQEMEALKNLSEIISSSIEIEKVIEYIYRIFNRFTGCDRYFICFIDKDTGELTCRYEFGSITFGEVGNYLYNDTSVRACFESRQPVVKINALIANRGSYGDKAALPLNISDEMVGVVFIESGEPDTFSRVNVDFMVNLANNAAVAIKNAEMFDNIYNQKQEIEALYEEAAAVNEELNSYIEELNTTKKELNDKNEELKKYYGEIQTGYLQTVMALANSIEANDPYTRGHCQRVMVISCEIAKSLNYTNEQMNELRYAAILHDIGKIGISPYILNKPSKLDDAEFKEIKKHPLIAYNILKDIEFIKNGREAILQHHERYDGKGYPSGLVGEKICSFARILSIADAFDAMTSDRPYRKGMTFEQALDELKNAKGTQFDPVIVDASRSVIYQYAGSNEVIGYGYI